MVFIMVCKVCCSSVQCLFAFMCYVFMCYLRLCVSVPLLDFSCFFWTINCFSWVAYASLFHSKFMDLLILISDTLISSRLCITVLRCVCLFMDAVLFTWVSDLHRVVSSPVKPSVLELCSFFNPLYSLFQTGKNIVFPHDGDSRITTALCYTLKSYKLT